MQKSIIIFILLFVAQIIFAQPPSDSAAIASLQQQVSKLQTDLKNQKSNFSKQLSSVNVSIGNLQSQIESQTQTITIRADSLEIKISEAAQTSNTQIADVNKSVSKKSLFAIIGGILLLLLSVALFVWLFKRQKANRADIIGQLEKTKSSVEEQLVKEFSKQVEVMDSLLKTLRELPVTAADSEPDHSLALKLADEITLMERNLSLMDSSTKGLKQLNRSVGKLKDNLAANGYEIPELLGKPYNEGLKVFVTNTVQGENLDKGAELISKIIKPQVNYHDKMIQAAQIEVSVG